MIGPGWMPSQPRPLARMRRGLDWHTARSARRRPRRTRSERSRAYDPAQDPAPSWLFEGVPAALPIATVRTSGSQVLAGDLLRWLGERWHWLRPRSIPLVVACAAMVLMLGAVNRLTVYAPAVDARPHARAAMTDEAEVQLARYRPYIQERSIPADIIYVGGTPGTPSQPSDVTLTPLAALAQP